MDAYPLDYVGHNLPLVLLSGIEPAGQESLHLPSSDVTYPQLNENGIQIFSDFPPLTDATAKRLLVDLLAEDASKSPWNARAYGGKVGGIGFRVKRVGRTYTLPPRKARPPIPSSSPSSSNHNEAAGAPLILHSPISPLTPASPTYPDGIATPLWVTKHQSLVPAAFVNFFPLTLDSNMASLRDNQLKIEINSLKKDWTSSGYKTRFVVALICEDGPVPGDINDRISSIRRATNLDLKNIFVLPPTPSQEDFRDFVRSLFSSLQGPCVEYYRDLSKHARRKRNRGSIPPPTAPPTTGTSQTLAAQGWNIRYEFKLGVFAEFRQEIDAACRSYESAYALLFGEEVFETIAGWSPRFDDARMLADVLAIRIIRCLLWTEQTTLAVRQTPIQSRQAPIYAPPEETISANERLYPWELLHHAGYWLNRAAKHTSRRRLLAEKIPDEDRSAPTQASPAQAKGRSNVYDTYLAPEPFDEYPLSGSNGTNHSKLIISYLTASSEEFSKRGQLRMVESQKLDMAREHMRLGEWEIALDILQSIWPVLTWRRDGWWHLMEEFGWALRECAHHVGHSETIIRVDWELMNRCFTPRVGWSYDLKRGVVDLPTVEPKPSIVFKEEEVISFLSASFAFQKLEGNVGEPLQSQLVIGSCAHGSASPISLTEVKVTFEGSLRPIKLQASHEAAIVACNQTEISNITLSDSLLSDSASILSHPSNLPSMITGEVKVSSITLMFEDDRFDITYVVTQQPSKESVWWTLGKKGAMSRRIGKDRDTSACNILPKPPKVLITTPSLRNHYYTDEHMVLDVLVDNEEDEPAEISVERRSIGIVDATCRRTLPLMFTDTSMPQDYELEISAFYHLVSDPATPIFKTVTLDLSFIRPFEANYELMPRVHPDAWPDFFHLDEPGFSDESESRAHGLQQRWCLNCKIISFAHEALLIDEVEVTVNGIAGGLVRQVGPALRKDNNAAEILPEQVCECDFNIELQRLALDDRQTTTLNLSLDIRWRRQGAEVASSSTIEAFIPKTTLPIPRFVIPMGEPRVLATVMPSSSALSGFIHLNYTLENPSMHLLTFNITMEASDQFAFSGPKSIAVQLVPLSRHTIQYNLLATGKDKWIQPQLVVVDSYYNKTLRVLPTEGMKADKKGILIHIA
uniref:Trafficking protein particle complex subunit 11 domain-containing protein n=1 Tax=Coccidioides posadasii RMSCC 3488 TaxID=454284 RepID=A0A0J6FH34_COCPO|nr:hypothetical protein CPAG_04535 [Coccidioides posadasii RMSCC 3488]